MLEVSGFEKQYGDVPVLAFDKLVFGPGISWIRGENGSGKSTLFKAIAGLIPFTGEVRIEGISLSADPAQYRRLVSFAEAEPLYPGFLSGEEIFRFVANARKTTPERITYYKKLLGIDSYYHKTCETYSSGMLKKLSLSLSFLGSAKVIILDEPLITLDSASCHVLLEEVNRCIRTQGTIFLISSHQAIEYAMAGLNSFVISNKTLTRADT